MIDKLFTYEDYDQIDDSFFIYFNCVLIKEFKGFKKLDQIAINFEKRTIFFWFGDKKLAGSLAELETIL